MDLRQLRYFIAVAEELHFSRAAARLHIAQPALSDQVRNLERELDVTLLDRSSRSVTLTSAGTAVLEQARRTLRRAEIAVERTKRAARGEVGHLTIGFVDSVAHELIPAVMRAFGERHPDVALELEEMQSSDRLAGFRSGQLDVAFVRLPIEPDPTLATAPLRADPTVAVVPEDHPLALERSVRLTDLADERWAFPARSALPASWEELQAICSRNGFVPNIAATAKTMEALVGLVATDAGITLLPATSRALPRAGVVAVAVEDLSTVAAVAWRADRETRPVREFVETALELAGSVGRAPALAR